MTLSSVKSTLEMDSTATFFTFSTMMDGRVIGIPSVVSIDDYVALSLEDRKGKLFKKIATGRLQSEQGGSSEQSFELIGADIAGQRVSLRVRGNVNITGKLRSEDRTKTTNVSNANQSNTFQIEQKQAFKIEGKIGDRISIQVDQDSERDFDFENNMEIFYNGNEDEIIQRIEAGNISLSLPGTKLAMFSGQNNGLFGLKALAKVGPIDITAIASLERGRKEKLSLNDDSEAAEVTVDDYNIRRNTYFYINHFYRRKSYPLNSNGAYERTGRTVQNIRVYKTVSSQLGEQLTNYAKVYNNPETDALPVTSRQVVQLVQGADGDFVLFEDLGVIRMNTPVQSNEVLAIAYQDAFIDTLSEIKTNLTVSEYDPLFNEMWTFQEGDDIALGTPGITDTLRLKMIKPDNALPSDPSWDLEWKNVYYLNTTQINKDGFDLKIKRSLGGDDSELADDGTPFLQLFGLDVRGVGTDTTKDGIIDLDFPNIINFYRGELIFPYLAPFSPDTVVTDQPLWMTNAIGKPLNSGGNPNLKNYPEYQSNSFYDNAPNTTEYKKDQKFRMHINYANQSSTFSLGFNVIEGSEEVTLNGVLLERGPSRDYTIDYFSGQLVILNEAALAPGADLGIKYELNEFFQLDKKVILGTRAEIKFGENKNSFLGLSAIYFSKSSIDEKVRVGKEPMENFIWDLNTKISRDLPWLTRGLDWLPLIKTDSKSNITVSGEVAQVIPNPNTSENKDLGEVGLAYIDDFEGSRREASLSIIRGAWGPASAPADGTLRGNRERAYTYWYNPYNRILTKQIWPNKETSAQAQNDVTDILVLNMIPDSSFAYREGDAPGDAWGGIMRALSSGYYDQSESKFLELWVKGETGRLHVDLGYISEDQQDADQEWTVNIQGESVTKGYGHLDTEDIREGFLPADGFVSEEEDRGYDGLWADSTAENLQLYGHHHPNWDVYKFEPNVSPINYRQINGTEGNLSIEGGTYPNSEDLNNDGALDTRNAYFTMDVDLTTEDYIAGRTKFSDNTETGWKLIRIPLADFRELGQPGLAQWSQIKFSRLWLDEVDEVPAGGPALQIATVDIVGNDWQERGVFSEYAAKETSVSDSLHGTLNVIVINTEDNPTRYNSNAVPGSYSSPPAGVEGILDPITQLRSKEQSLVIRADNLAPGYTVVADKLFQGSKAKDFIHYKTMKMFVHGWDRLKGGIYESGFTDYVEGDDSNLEFFFRFGETDKDYYEVRRPIFPGWDERNHLDINMADLANFKLALEDSIFIISTNFFGDLHNEDIKDPDSTVYDTLYWSELPADIKYASQKLADGSTIAVKGKPSLSRVKLMKTGFRNRTDQPMSGEIWMDELRLSDVEKNTATAYRANLSMQFADIAKINMDIQRDDADFHNVQQQFGTGDNSVAANISGNLSVDKLLPTTWGLNIPLSMSYRQSEKQPKYITGSDIRIVDLDPSLQDTLETMTNRNEAYSWNASISKKAKSEHWLPKYTIDNMNFKVGSTNSTASNAQKSEQKAEKVDGNFSYKLNLGNDFKVTPFAFLEKIPLIGEKIASTEIGYLPSNIGLDGSMAENKSSSVFRNPNAQPLKPTHQLSMNRHYNVDWNLLSTLSAKFSANLSNNLDSLKDRKEDIIRELDFGHLGNYKETYNFSWNPKGLKLLSPSLSYSSNFSATDKINVDQPGLDLNVSSNSSANLSVKIADVFGLIYKPEKANKSTGSSTNAQPARGRGRGRVVDTPDPDSEKSDLDSTGQADPFTLTKLLDFTYNTLDRIDAISMNVTQGQNTANYRQIASLDTIAVTRGGDTTGDADSLVLVVKEMELSNVGYGYRMGFNTGLHNLNHPDATNPVATTDNFNLTARSGLRLTQTMTTKFTFTFGQKTTLVNKSQGEVVSTNIDFLPSGSIYGKPKDEFSSFGTSGFPMPSFNLRYSGLKDIEWLKKYITGASLDLNYAGKKTAKQDKGVLTGETYSIAFSPLIGLSIQGKKGINGSLNYSLTKNISNTISVDELITSNQNFNQSVNAGLSYSHRGGMTIPLPMMEDKYLENNIDFRLEIAYTHEQEFIGTETESSLKFRENSFTKTLSARPSIQYSFTDKVSGNISYDYRITDTRAHGQQNVSDFQFGVNIQIKG